jgi:hypothetical protein
MERITQEDIDEMRSRGYDRSTIADAQARLALCQRADELIEQIAAAFAGVTLGDGIGLWESDGIDDYRGADELRALRAKDEKMDWRRIPANDLSHCNAAPSFLDARGLYFHTPAFMTAELRGEFKQDFIGRLIYNSLTAPEFRDLLTPDQRHVIIACISFYGSIEHYSYDADVISNAILRYSTDSRDKQ